ncbi:hypothetical protein ACFOPX_00650 [Helicobacter baculiformis]|uniref:Lipoprotein n=1 Tax=Helicobacter baculiformis TaxID=427351 RepID=A0ABV7ZGT6_9HELI|nr:hypothetical protein [Helicobacter baculiformis]
MALRYSWLLGLLLLSGCSDQQHKGKEKEKPAPSSQKVHTSELPTSWQFVDQHGKSVSLKRIQNGLVIPSKTPLPTLVLFLGLQPKFAPYVALLNHLRSIEHGVGFIGILDKHYPQEQVDAFSKAHTPQFALLNPVSDVSSLGVALQSKTWALPYFMLYTKEGALYQSYHGAIVEEMLAKDIQDLLKR